MIERKCGDCQLCCKLLPVVILGKKANERCKHQKTGRGCTIYPQRPPACRIWSCGWLRDTSPEAELLSRPDRSRVVVDTSLDFVVITDNGAEPGENPAETKLPVIQVWCDPKDRTAHRDPKLRQYLEHKVARFPNGAAVVVRFSSKEATTLIPPMLSSTREWIEIESGLQSRPQHSPQEIAEVLAQP